MSNRWQFRKGEMTEMKKKQGNFKKLLSISLQVDYTDRIFEISQKNEEIEKWEEYARTKEITWRTKMYKVTSDKN